MVDKTVFWDKIHSADRGVSRELAEVAELADALRSGRSSHYGSEGSNPSFGTGKPAFLRVFLIPVYGLLQ